MDGANVCRQRGCVFSIILWVIIIVVVLLALGYFARGRRREAAEYDDTTWRPSGRFVF